MLTYGAGPVAFSLHPERVLEDGGIGAGEGMFAGPLHPPTTGGSFVFTGGRIRTPEPLRDRVLSPPRNYALRL